MNVRINLSGLKDEKVRSALQEKVRGIRGDSEAEFEKIHQIVKTKMG